MVLEESLEFLIVVDIYEFVTVEHNKLITAYDDIESCWIVQRCCQVVGHPNLRASYFKIFRTRFVLIVTFDFSVTEKILFNFIDHHSVAGLPSPACYFKADNYGYLAINHYILQELLLFTQNIEKNAFYT